jgi:hypothetical protein
LTAFLTTVLTAAIVSVVVTVLTTYVYQPVQAQKQLIAEIDNATRYYRRATMKKRNWITPEEGEKAKAKAEEATEAILMLSARLAASPATFPGRGKSYRLFEALKLALSRESVDTASSELIAWVLWIKMGDDGAARSHRLEVIKALGLSGD